MFYLNLFAGNYFSTHFIMGGEKFDTPQPEAYLFGENMDLNFFSKCPTTVSKYIHIHNTLHYKINNIDLIQISSKNQ